jgi:hypothetical protein
MLPFSVTIPATVQQRSEILEGLMNYPVLSNSDTPNNKKRYFVLSVKGILYFWERYAIVNAFGPI